MPVNIWKYFMIPKKKKRIPVTEEFEIAQNHKRIISLTSELSSVPWPFLYSVDCRNPPSVLPAPKPLTLSLQASCSDYPILLSSMLRLYSLSWQVSELRVLLRELDFISFKTNVSSKIIQYYKSTIYQLK